MHCRGKGEGSVKGKGEGSMEGKNGVGARVPSEGQLCPFKSFWGVGNKTKQGGAGSKSPTFIVRPISLENLNLDHQQLYIVNQTNTKQLGAEENS